MIDVDLQEDVGGIPDAPFGIRNAYKIPEEVWVKGRIEERLPAQPGDQDYYEAVIHEGDIINFTEGFTVILHDRDGRVDAINDTGSFVAPGDSAYIQIRGLNADETGGIETGEYSFFIDRPQNGVANGFPTPDSDSITGFEKDDTINALAGDDTVVGNGGNDLLMGGDGNDSLIGGDGSDSLSGGAGDDFLNGGYVDQASRDLFITGTGDDTISFEDLIDGGSGSIGLSDFGSGAIIDVNGIAGTGFIDKLGNGSVTILHVNNVLNGLALELSGSFDRNFDNVFNILLDDGQNLQMGGQGGNNTYNIDAASEGHVRLDFSRSEEGIVADLSTGVIENGWGGEDQINKATDQTIELRGSRLADDMNGGTADESFIGYGGNDTIDGGAGFDRIRFDRIVIDDPVFVNLAAGTASGSWWGEGFVNTLSNIERVEGTLFANDTLLGDAQDNALYGRGGDDSLVGGDGDDTLIGGDGNDTITGGAGDDTLAGLHGDDTAIFDVDSDSIVVGQSTAGLVVTSSEGVDFVYGSIGTLAFNDVSLTHAEVAALAVAETVTGTDASENLDGTRVADEIDAGGGGDWITPGAGSDTIDGGSGRDMVSFFDLEDTFERGRTEYRLDLDLTEGRASTSGDDVYTMRNVERVTGSIFADRIKGDAGDNEIRGLGDYDWMIGTEGSDSYDGGTGRDMISYLDATSGVTVNLANASANTGLAAGDTYTSVERVTGSVHIDIFYGDDGENEFRGLGGYDVFYGSAGGRERYDGGNGSDTVSYLFSDAGVVANLARGFGSGGDAARDLYTSIENLGGTNFDDLLLGDEGRNNLRGLSGDDFLFGAGGIDRIFGGRGDDTIDGGDGSDFILYRGDRADFDIEREAGTRNATVTWTGSGAGDGTDTLTNVEYFVFDDETVNIWSL